MLNSSIIRYLTKNIVIADEFPIYRFVTKSYISKCWPNAKVVEAGSLQEVLSSLSNKDYELLFIDVYMSDYHVFDEFVKEANRNNKVVIFSEYVINSAKVKRLKNLAVNKMLLKSASGKEVISSFQTIFVDMKMKSA